nr:MAG TPA: hypothetical protein [Caudoviricetes sp.]
MYYSKFEIRWQPVKIFSLLMSFGDRNFEVFKTKKSPEVRRLFKL